MELPFPEFVPYKEEAIDIVVSVINRAQHNFNTHHTLKELRSTREALTGPSFVSVKNLKNPLIVSGEAIIREAIEKRWKLTDVLMYTLKYLKNTNDDLSCFFYFEAIFSQPTQKYPIPQATASIFFRIQQKNFEPEGRQGVPLVQFRLEGHHQDYDIRYVKLTPDWILGLLQLKLRVFRRIEEFNLF